MDIAMLNVRITFQKNVIMTDDVGNHKNEWTDVWTCYATVSGENGDENNAAGQTVEDGRCAFTVRWSSETERIRAASHRIVFGNEYYDIVSVDHLNFRKKALKFICKKVRR